MIVAYICSMKRGLASFIYREIENLFDRGAEVIIFTTKYSIGLYMPKKEWKCFPLKKVRTILCQPLRFAKNPFSYLKLLCHSIATKSVIDFLIAFYYLPIMIRNKVDIIHCNEGLHPFWIGYYCYRVLQRPLSVTIHADTFYVNPNMKITRIALKKCAKVITVSDYNKRKLVEEFGIDEKKVEVVRIAIDTESFDFREKKKILIVGQYAERKGHDTLFKAVKRLNRDDVELWVVGSGSWGGSRDYVDVEKLARDIGVDDRTAFFKNIPESFLKFLYQNCDIFCLPSKISKDGNREGIPVSLMEAMALKKPVVSTYHTGIPELVMDNLVKENDDESLAKILDKLLGDEKLRTEQGERNRKKIIQEYSKENTTKLFNIFKDMEKESAIKK